MAAPLILRIIGDATAYYKTAETTVATNTKIGASFERVGVSANLSADAQIRAAVRAQQALKANAVALSSRASSLPTGSREQVAATRLATEAQEKYARAIGVTTVNTSKLAGESSRFRGILGGTAGFLGLTLGAAEIGKAIEGADRLESAQRSLDAAIESTGGNLALLRPQYRATAREAARFGQTEADALTALSRATLLTGDAVKAQHAYEEALVISKATGKDFGAVLIAASKGQAGLTTSLRRYVPELVKGASGQEQFNQVMERYQGQAEANTSATDRFKASLGNLEAEIASGLMPVLNPAIDGLSKLLGKYNEAQQSDGFFQSAFHSLPTILNKEVVGRYKELVDYFGGNMTGSGGSQGLADTLRQELQIAKEMSGGASGGPSGVPRRSGQTFFQLTPGEQIARADAALTRSMQDDVVAAKSVVARIKHAIESGKYRGKGLIAALQAEASALGVIWAAEDAAAQKRAEAAQRARDRIAAQIQDSIDPLKLEVALSRAEALGKPTEAILRKIKASAEKALRSGKLSLEQQKEAWDEIASINQQLATQSHHRVAEFKQAKTRALTAGLGLTEAQRAELRARLSQLGPGGTTAGNGTGAYGYQVGRDGHVIHLHNVIELDGKPIARNTTRHQEKHRRRNSRQRRGPNAG